MSDEPQTREELRQAAILASAWLAIDAARELGLVTGGPDVNRERCEEIVQRAEDEGVEIGDGEVLSVVGILGAGR